MTSQQEFDISIHQHMFDMVILMIKIMHLNMLNNTFSQNLLLI